MSSLEVQLFGKKAAGRVAIVDAGDYDLVSAHRWYVYENVRPAGNSWGPWAVTILRAEGRRLINFAMHTLITGWPLVDHANGNGLDNRRSNLRHASIAQNSQNRRPPAGSSSPYKGVCWNKASRKWQAGIKIDGRSRYLGLYLSEEDAALAYDKAAREAYGEFAYLNFPAVA